jgi:hypothetical protein
MTVTKGSEKVKNGGEGDKDLGILPRGAGQFVSVKGGEELREGGARVSLKPLKKGNKT